MCRFTFLYKRVACIFVALSNPLIVSATTLDTFSTRKSKVLVTLDTAKVRNIAQSHYNCGDIDCNNVDIFRNIFVVFCNTKDKNHCKIAIIQHFSISMKILPKNAEKNTFLSIYYFSVAAERANFGGYIVQVMEYTVVGAGGPPLS